VCRITFEQQAAINRAKELLGNGYIFGATGWVCSLAKRKAQAAQYPQYYDMIMKTGAKWDGKVCWDCAQFTKTVAKAGGITLPSGATSQWKSGVWVAKGTIDTLPKDAPAFLYRQTSDGVMQHTGFYLSNNAVVHDANPNDYTFIHSKGTAYGVLQQELGDYAWTHWATPWKSDTTTGSPSSEATLPAEVLYKAEVYASKGSTVRLRKEPNGAVIVEVPVGTVVEVNAVVAGYCKITANGVTGFMQTAFLRQRNNDFTAYQGKVTAQTGKTVRYRLTPNGKKLGELPIGTEVSVQGESADWSVIEVNGRAAYMKSEFITVEA